MKKFIEEFKAFAIKGNMIDLAVGMVIGTAFTTIVKSIVDDIIMPIVGILIGGRDFSGLAIQVGDATIKYGILIQNLVNFLIIAMFLFCVVKTINMLKRKKEEVAEPVKIPEDIVLLEQIKETLIEIKNK